MRRPHADSGPRRGRRSHLTVCPRCRLLAPGERTRQDATMPRVVSCFAPLLLSAVVAAQGFASIDRMVEALGGRDVAARNRAFVQLVEHPERRAVASAMGRLLPRERAAPWNTAVGVGDGRKYAPTPRDPETMLWTDAPAAPPCIIEDDLDLEYDGWSVQALAAAILGRLGADALPELDALVRTLSAHEDGASACAAWALTQVGQEGAKDLVGRWWISARTRADILTAFGVDGVGVAQVVALIASRSAEQSRLGGLLAAGWHLADDDVRAALVRATARRDGRDAVSALLALGAPAVPDLIALVRSSKRGVATSAAAAFALLLARPTPLPEPLQADAIDALGALVPSGDADGEGDGGVDAAHAALRALALVELGADLRARLRAVVEEWCRSDEEAWRFLGFRHLGAFGYGAESVELVAQGLRDEFHNIAGEAAIAASRVGVPMSEAICGRLCESAYGGSRSAAVLLRFVAPDPDAAAELLRAEHARRKTKAVDLLLAAAERDEERALTIGAEWADPTLPADALLAIGPMTPERWRKLDAIGGRDRDRLRVLVEVLSRQGGPAPQQRALLIRALEVGVEEAWERGGEALAADALDLLTRMSPADLAPHRDVFLQALHDPWLRVRQRAAALLRTLPR